MTSWLRATPALFVLLAACGDDGGRTSATGAGTQTTAGTATDGTAGTTTDGTPTTSATTSAATSDSDGTTNPGTTMGTTGGPTTGITTVDPTDTTTGGEECLPPDVLILLDRTQSMHRTPDGQPCPPSEVDDWSSLIGIFQSGAVGVWEGSTLMKGYHNNGFGYEWAEVNGSLGSAAYQLTDPNNVPVRPANRPSAE